MGKIYMYAIQVRRLTLSICILSGALFSGSVLSQSSFTDELRQEKAFPFVVEGQDLTGTLSPFPPQLSQVMASHPEALSIFGDYYIYFEHGLYSFDGKTYRQVHSPSNALYRPGPHLFSLSPGAVCLSQPEVDSLGHHHSLVFLRLSNSELFEESRSFKNISEQIPHPLEHISQLSSRELLLATRDEQLFLLNSDSIRQIPIAPPIHSAKAIKDYIVGFSYGDSGHHQVVRILNTSGAPLWSSPKLPSDSQGTTYHIYWTDTYLFVVEQNPGSTSNGYKIYIISLDSEFHSVSTEWKVVTIAPSKMRFRFPAKDGLVFSSIADPSHFFIVSADGVAESSYFTSLSRKIHPLKLMHPIEATVMNQRKWFLTNGGLLSVEPARNTPTPPLTFNTVQNINARGMEFQRDNMLWVSSHTGVYGLSLGDPPHARVLSLPSNACTKQLCYSLHFEDSLLFNVSGNGIHTYNLSTKKCSSIAIPVKIKDHVFSFAPLDSSLLVGTAHGLLRFDKISEQGSLHPLPLFQGDKAQPPLFVHRIKRHANTDTFFVCSQKGLYIVHISPTSAERGRILEKVLDEHVHDAHFLSDGRLLVATQNSGLLCLNTDKDRKIQFTFSDKNHLQSNFTHNIQEDGMGRLWLGTNLGLYLIDFAQRRVYPFGKEDGMPGDEFNRLSSAKNSSGRLAFGGVDGVAVFDPLAFRPSYSQRPATIVSLWGQRADTLCSILPLPEAQSKPHFKIPKGVRAFRPLFTPSPALCDLQLFYRTDSNHFWQRVPDHFIPVDPHSQAMDIQLLWQSPEGTVFHSQMRLLPSEKKVTSYVYFFIALLLLLLAGLQLRTYLQQRKRSSSPSLDTEEAPSLISVPASDASVVLESKDNKKLLSPLERLQIQLKNKEEDEYSFPETISSDFLADLKSVIEENVGKNEFDVSFVAHQLNISPRQFHRKVVTATGLTPNQLFTLFKMKKAKSLIFKNTDLRNIQLAEKVGYNNASYFSSKFKEMYGLTPKALATRIDKISRGDYYEEEE